VNADARSGPVAVDAAHAVVAVAATTVVGRFQVRADLTAPTGITVLTGPSGSGKSVTLATIAGLLRPTHGTVAIDGRTVADGEARLHVPSQSRRVGIVFQQPTLLPHLTPVDDVALAVRGAHRVPRARARALARDWLERVGVAHLADAAPQTLSGGEQQRVALARALAGDPRVLLLDEPFSAVDRPTRQALRALVRDLVDERRIAALVVSHDLDDVLMLADRIVRYEPGASVGVHDVRGLGVPAVTALLTAGTGPAGLDGEAGRPRG
jgi:molybdate transport system ATP-binding protein